MNIAKDDLTRTKRFHCVCVAALVGFFIVKSIIAARSSIYILVGEQLLGVILGSIIFLGWLHAKINTKERAESVSDMMITWYLGFFLAIVLAYGLVSIREQDRIGRELRAKMTDDEWEELNEQIREDARQDWLESRHP